MADRLNSQLRVVPDIPAPAEEVYVQRAVKVVTQDHLGRPEAAATADTALRLAQLFAQVRQQSPHHTE